MPSLHFELHLATDLVESDALDDLHEALVALEPSFCSRLRVLEYEGDRSPTSVPDQPDALRAAAEQKGLVRGAVFEQLDAEGPPARYPRRFGNVLVRGRAAKTWLSLKFDQYTPAMPMGQQWLFSNSISGNTDADRVGRLPAQSSIADLLRALAERRDDVLWGAAWDRDEFRANNLDESRGVSAMGRDVRRHLPGLYWINVFGGPYIDLIGRDVLLRCPAHQVHDAGRAITLALYGEPDAWASPEGRARKATALEHLGHRYFFDRAAPDRPTSAPDFGLPELSASQPLQVITSDGKNFTPMPRVDDEPGQE